MSVVSKSLIAAIALCTLVACTAIMAQETPKSPEASPGSDFMPPLAELMVRFAEIEAGYLPFHIEYSQTVDRYSQTSELIQEPSNAGRLFEPRSTFEYLTQRGHQSPEVWMVESTSKDKGVSRTERELWQDSKLHRKEPSPSGRYSTDDFDKSIEPSCRPLEGIFPLLFGTKFPIRVSEHFAAAPSEFTWEWREELARVMCHYRPKNDKHIAVELWLDPDYGWHPVFMRRYEIHTGERFPDEWKALQFLRLGDQVRISLGDFNGPIRGGKVSTDEFSPPFIRSRFEILKSAYQNRVAAAAFSPDTPIGGSPIAELEPVGGEQVEVKSSSIAELSPPALTPEQILAFAAVTNRQPATKMQPADSLNPTSTALPNEIQSQIAALEVELIVQKADLGERHPTIKKLNDKITALREAGAELLGQVTVLHLKNARAKDVAEKIEQLFPDKTRNLVVDERTNSLMLRGDEKLLRDVEQIVQILDAAVPPGGENANTDPHFVPSMKTPGETLPVPATRSPFGGENSERMSAVEGSLASNPPVPIAEYRRRLADLETPVMQLAEKVRAVETSLGKDHPDAVKQRAGLRALVRKNFAERQEIQRAELAEFTRRLERMQRSIEAREKVAEKIVDRRVEELLHPDNSTESNSNLLDRTALPLTGSRDDVNTSALTAAARLITKTYPVGNYVTATFFDQAIALQNPAPSLDAAADSIRQKAEELIAQISSHNKPAAISFDSARLQLVVSHTAEGHRALGELFATIKLPMQEKLTFSRCEVNEQIYSAFKDSPVWTAFDEFRNEVEDGGWIGVRKKEFVKWFERVLQESPAGEDFGQPTSLVLTAGVPYQFDAGEIRVTLTARIDPANQKPQLRIDYAELSGRPSGTRMISDLEDLAVWIPSSEECITFLVYESAQGGSFPRRDSLQKQDAAPPQPIAITPDVTEEVPGSEIVSLTLFEVSDPTFMPSEDSAPGQSLSPDKFDKQLENMLKNKTAKLIGKHAIETTENRLATLNSGGKFEVPSSSPEKKAEVVFGTTIEITPRTLNGERVFQILWSERVRNFENAVNGIPGIDEKRIEVNINSPSPGGAGYLFGPLKGKNQTRRMFVHFLLHSASSDEPPGLRHDPSTEPQFKDPNAALRPRLQGVTGETTADQSFVRGEVPPTSDAEKSVGRLVLVFANDAARRMVPALMVNHGERTLALTVGPATIVPDDTPHAIDRTFLEFYNRDDVPTEYSQELEFPDLRAYEAKESLTEFQLEKLATVELSDQLSAIINHGQADFKVKTDAARVTAVEQSTTWELPSHNVTREFTGLVQIDQRLPEGTPLFKNGELAGITLLGTRFMKNDVPGSYVVPVSRIFEVLQQLKTK